MHVQWSSKLQPTVALSTTEAEYRALSDGVREVMWIYMLLAELGHTNDEATTIFSDNQSSIKLVKNPLLHARTFRQWDLLNLLQ